jgi:hypothetical protein
LAEPIRQFIGKVAGSPASELGEYVADHIRLRRFKSNIRIMEAAERYVAEAGLEPSVIPYKTLVPLLERGSLEDDESMIEKWAALLANAAADPAAVLPSYAEILGQLSPVEARIVNELFRLVERVPIPRDEWAQRGAVTDQLRVAVGLDEPTFLLYLDNLRRLRLCTPPAVGLDFVSGDDRYQLFDWRLVCITDLGHAFARACQPPA